MASELHVQPDPATEVRLRRRDDLRTRWLPPLRLVYLSLYGAGLTALVASVSAIILPARVLALVPASQKNSYLGLLSFAALATAMLVQPLAGALSDRLGRRIPFIALGSAAALALLPLLALPIGYGALLATAVALAAATNLGQGPYQALITDRVPPSARGRAAALKVLAEVLGGAAAAALVGLLLGRSDAARGGVWLWAAVATPGALLLLTAGLTVWLVRESHPAGADTSPTTPFPTRAPARAPAARAGAAPRSFALFLASRLLVMAALSVMGTYGYFYMRDVVGIPNPASATGLVVAVAALAMLAVAYPTGVLSDRLGPRLPILLSGLLGLLGVVLLVIAPGMGHLLAGSFLLGTAAGIFLSASWGMATKLVPEARAGFYLGLTNLATAGGEAVVRLSGLGVDRLNVVGPQLGYRVLLWACAACFVAGALLVLPLERRRD